MVEFTNKGKYPLHNLKVSSTNPEFFTFGMSAVNAPTPPADSSSVYQTIPETTRSNNNELSCKVSTVSHVVDVPMDTKSLAPGVSMAMPMWIRGGEKSGMQEIHFLFYYESKEENPKIR